MKSKMNRALSMLFALVMVLTVFPVMTSTATAAEESYLAADDLYVKDGATLWLTPESGLDLAAGTWESQVGDLSATIKGGVYNADSNKDGWRLNAQGVPYYRIHDIATFSSNRDGAKTGIILPTAAISDGNFTFETVFKPLYLSDEAGTIAPHTGAVGGQVSQWGAYGTAVSMFSIAGLQLCFFNPSVHDSGNSSRMRFYYHPAAWETVSPNYGKPSNHVVSSDVRPFGDYSADTNTLVTVPVTMSVVRRSGYGSTDVYTRFTTVLNGITVFSGNRDGRDPMLEDASNYVDRPFYNLETLAAQGGKNKPFQAFVTFPAEVYAIRAYNRALSVDEVNSNHLADLISILNVSVSKSFYNGLSDYERSAFLEKVASVRIQDGAAALQNVIASFQNEENALAGRMTDYDKLYVQTGLVQLLSAFTKAEADAAISAGKWENKITAGKDAVLKNSSATFAWKALANGGIGYDMTQAELTAGNANNTYLDLGNAVVDPYQNFSVEYVSKLKRTSDGVDNNHNTGHSTEKFGIWGSWSFRAASWRLLYHDYGKENHWGHGVGWYGDANFTSASSIVTVANRMSAYLSGDKVDCSRYIFANGVQKSATSNVVASGKGKYNEVCYDFYLMLNVANETYAVRVYDRELSNDEILRNSVVDRWAYNGITVNSLIGKPDAIVMHAVNACKNLPFEANEDQKAAMQDAVDAAVALYVNMINVRKDEYDSLYVQDGMSMLFSAYDNTDSSLDLANGLWYNKAEAGVATIVGGLYNASSNKMGWQKGEKGIYWTQRASVSQGSQKNGIYFDINDLPEGEYTVEQIVAYDGITNDDGSKWDSTWKYKADNSGVSGARYGYNVEAFAFGAVRSLSFISNKHYKQLVDDDGNNVGTASTSGDGAQNRWYYTGLTYNEHGSNPSGYGAAIAGVDADKSWQNYKAGEIVNFTATYDYIGGDTYDTASSAKFTVRYNGAVGGEFTANAGCANKVEEYATTLLPNNAGFNKRGWEVYNNQKFHTMVGIAGSIYAIRVYDRTLTEAEMKQNHAVDLMAYFNMDVTGFAAASEEAKVRVYEAFAGKTFAASALEVSVMQTAIDRAVEDSIVGVVVSQKSNDGTALRIVGALETMENVSRVGFVITFKQNGEVVKTFGEATAENTATVTKTVFSSVTASGISYSADALCAEYLYAAVVKGVPAGTYTVEVTPFYVDVEDNVFTGEMKSQTVTF